jgi:electron transfer flavoprotein beta subunit
MRSIVCLKVVPKTEEIRLDAATRTVDRSHVQNEINPPDKNALELALELKERLGGEVVLLSMGPRFFESYMLLGIACGADDAVLLSDSAFAGADTYSTSYALAGAVKKMGKFDLILCGEESSDASTGQVPPGIAEWLDIAQLTSVTRLDIVDKLVRAMRTIKGGYEVVETALPALVSVKFGCNSLRFPDFRRRRNLENDFKVTVWTAADLGANPDRIGAKGSHTVVEKLQELPKPSRRMERISGSPEEEVLRIVQKMKETLAI